jgi:hypothetical protein
MIPSQLFSKRDQSLENLLSSTANPSKISFIPSSSPPTESLPVAESLMLKHAQTQARLSALRLSKQSIESKNLQSVPKINKISKQIAELKEGRNDSVVSSYANSIVSGSKPGLLKMMHPRQSFLSLAELAYENEEGETACFTSRIHRKAESIDGFSDCKTARNEKKAEKFGIKIGSKEKTLAKVDVNDLRNAMMMRNEELKEKEKEKILEMSVLKRNEYWLRKKKEKIEEKKDKKVKEEVKMCSFSPALAPKVDLSKDSRRIKQNTNSYAQKYIERGSQPRPPKPVAYPEPKLNITTKTDMSIYQALSPHMINVSKASSLNIMKNAVPMISYKT